MTVSQTTRIIEILKSILLLVLFMTTILLLCVFWGGAAFRNLLSENVQSHEAIDLIQLLQPDRTEICLGGGVYTVTENKFPTIMDCFMSFSGSRNLSMEEISEDSYMSYMQTP